MKTGQIIEWAVVDDRGNTFAFRKTRKEIRSLYLRLDPFQRYGFRIAKIVIAK